VWAAFAMRTSAHLCALPTRPTSPHGGSLHVASRCALQSGRQPSCVGVGVAPGCPRGRPVYRPAASISLLRWGTRCKAGGSHHVWAWVLRKGARGWTREKRAFTAVSLSERELDAIILIMPPDMSNTANTQPSDATPSPPDVIVSASTIPGFTRAVRRRTDLSQRQLAKVAEVSNSTIARIEAGSLAPSLDVFLRILSAANLKLVVTDAEGAVIRPKRDWDDLRDGGGRRFPAHLDLIVDPEPGEWWADEFGLSRPPETYRRSRVVRDAERKYSEWSVRVKQHRNEPPPPNPKSPGFERFFADE